MKQDHSNIKIYKKYLRILTIIHDKTKNQQSNLILPASHSVDKNSLPPRKSQNDKKENKEICK